MHGADDFTTLYFHSQVNSVSASSPQVETRIFAAGQSVQPFLSLRQEHVVKCKMRRQDHLKTFLHSFRYVRQF